MALWTILALLHPIFTLFVFRNFGNQVDQNYTTTYFLLQGIVESGTFLFIDGLIAEQIFEGALSQYLLKPYSYVLNSLAKYCTAPIIKWLIGSPFIILVLSFLIFKGYVVDISFLKLLLFFLSIPAGLLLNLSFIFIIAFSIFWFDKVWFLSDLGRAIIFIFSGSTIPLFVFSGNFSKIINILPFRYMLSFQLEIIISKSLPSFHSFLIFGLYIIAGWSTVYLLFKKGLKRYEAFGS